MTGLAAVLRNTIVIERKNKNVPYQVTAIIKYYFPTPLKERLPHWLLHNDGRSLQLSARGPGVLAQGLQAGLQHNQNYTKSSVLWTRIQIGSLPIQELCGSGSLSHRGKNIFYFLFQNL